MFKRPMILVFSSLLFFPVLALAQGLKPPDVSTWKPVKSNAIHISSSEGINKYLGFDVEYQNPNNASERAKVLYKFTSFVSISLVESEKTPFSNIANYDLESEVEIELQRFRNKADSFLIIVWRIVVDPQTSQENKDGDTIGCILGSFDGVWHCQVWEASAIPKILIMDISEPNKYNPDQLILVGRKYSINGINHVIMTDQDYFVSKE